MEATTVKVKGILPDSRVMLKGITLLNPYRTFYGDSYSFAPYLRIPNKTDVYFYMKVYDGRIGSSTKEFEIVKTETIGESVVRTYRTTFSSSSISYTDPNSDLDNPDIYLGRQVRMIDKDNIPWRIDILGEDIDLVMPGDGSSGYKSPFVVDAEQIKYSTISKYGVNVRITGNTGAIKTSWFRDNSSLVRFVCRGRSDIQGTIMDFVKAGKTIGYMDFTSHIGIKGNMREFLDALTASGVKRHTIEMHITDSSIVQNVYNYNEETGKYSGGVFKVVFHNDGSWTTQPKSLKVIY